MQHATLFLIILIDHVDELAAKLVLASEIAHDPQTRKALRRDLDTRAVISVKPTDRGFTIIDELHPLHVSDFYRMLLVSIAHIIS